MEIPSISEFYRGRSVFITGATGFCGKVLLEKLLRSCPEITNIYITIRSKRGHPPGERLKALFDLAFFDRLKKEQPNALDKVVAMHGDITELGLGISEQDKQALQENVSVVFHVAAVVRFDDTLRNAVLMNVRGTREVLEIASGMKKIKAFLHVSTAYCNTDRLVNEEKVHPAPISWRALIKAVETIDDNLLHIITPKILGTRPNTYTFTKAVTEELVSCYADKLPVIIHRPSIVISTMSEPQAGWIDNVNGPVGMMVACAKGILRVSLSNPNIDADYIPVDLAIRSMIVASWDKAVRPVAKECTVYNCASKATISMKSSQVAEEGLQFSAKYPLRDILWIPGHTATQSRWLFYFWTILYHLLPALVYDAAMRITGGKPMLAKLQRRIYIANTALSYFLLHEWDFPNDKILELETRMTPEDQIEWKYNYSHIDAHQFLHDTMRGGMVHLMKEDPAWMPEAKRNYKRMYWLDKTVRAVGLFILTWLFWNSGFIQQVFTFFYDRFLTITS